MKERIIILLLSTFFVLSCSDKKSVLNLKNDISSYGLNGKIKSISTIIHRLNLENGSLVKGEEIERFNFSEYSLKKFNQDGFITYQKKSDKQIYYHYDSQNRLMKIEEQENREKKPSVFYKNFYDKTDSLSKTIYINENYKRIIKIKRDRQNRPIERIDYVQDTVEMKFEVKYDNHDNIIVENSYVGKSKPSKLTERTFNKNNKLVEENIKQFSIYDTTLVKNSYSYNDQGQLVEIKRKYMDDSVFEVDKFKYNAEGTLIEEKWIPKGREDFVITTRKFNKYGDLIEYTKQPSDDREENKWTTQYKYDQQKNWIEKKEFKNDSPSVIINRNIKYYN